MISAVILGMLTCLTVDVTFIELNGSEDTGEWLACDQTGYVALRTKIGVQRLATRDLLAVRFPENAEARTEITWPMIVWGTSGSRFPATALQSNEEQFVLRTPFARELHLPLDHVAAVYWTRHGEPSQEFVNSVKARGTEDRMFSIKDDKLRYFEGTVKRLGAEGGRFAFRGREVDFESSKVAGVVLGGTPVVVAAPVVCTLQDGYRITGDLVSTTLSEVRLTAFGGMPVSIPLTMINELRLASARSIPLSGLEPARVVQTSMFDEPWPVRRDRAAGGGALSIRGRVFESGLGMHARTSVTYDVPEGVKTLAAIVGIDDAACDQGRATFKVMAGARVLHTTSELGVDDEPLTITVDITTRRRITLVAESEGLDLCAHANWGEVRFVK